MRNNDDLKFKIIGAIVGLILLRHLWPIIVAVLALVGLFYMWGEYNRNKPDRWQ